MIQLHNHAQKSQSLSSVSVAVLLYGERNTVPQTMPQSSCKGVHQRRLEASN